MSKSQKLKICEGVRVNYTVQLHLAGRRIKGTKKSFGLIGR